MPRRPWPKAPNLALRFDQVGDRLFVGAESLVVLSVSNAGPTAAAAVRITNVFSVGTVVRSVTPAPMLVVDQTYVFDLGSLGGAIKPDPPIRAHLV